MRRGEILDAEERIRRQESPERTVVIIPSKGLFLRELGHAVSA
jgi:hypothetical protein